MKTGKIIGRIICMIISVIMIILLVPASGQAAKSSSASLTIQYLTEGAEIKLYKVAEFTEAGRVELTDSFEKYEDVITDFDKIENNLKDIDTETWKNLANSLQYYVITDDVQRDYVTTTDAQGKAVFGNLEKGLYLMIGETVESDGVIYHTSPLLVKVPTQDVADFSGKFSPEDDSQKLSVIKIWNDDGYENKRPINIIVELYQDEELYDTIKLHEDNNWMYTWEELPGGCLWHVIEKEIPDGYTVQYYVDGEYQVIDNTYTPDEPGPGEKLPQTGQLWWPVPFLAIAGVVIFFIGWLERRKEDRYCE